MRRGSVGVKSTPDQETNQGKIHTPAVNIHAGGRSVSQGSIKVKKQHGRINNGGGTRKDEKKNGEMFHKTSEPNHFQLGLNGV